MITERNATYLILWNDGETEYTNTLDLDKLGKCTVKDFPSRNLPQLVKYDVYRNGCVRNLKKYNYGVKR